MELYLVDIQRKDGLMDERDAIVGDNIILNRDLIRGYSLNYYMILSYVRFMNEVIGKYVDLVPIVCDVPEGLNSSDCEAFIMSKYDCIYTEIQSYDLPNGGNVIFSESILEHSTSIWEYENIWEYILVLYDDIIKYVPAITNNDEITDLRQFIFDGITSKIRDIYDDCNKDYTFDPYAILRVYIMKLLFIS